ncbi:nitrate reductase [Oceanobacter mangrovi]|uniref:nitrate reductase n=1 Tax=Oceanobacter mangrovi TaxID=2862510 RepID=UPI001C8E08F9|nr:nitrate reductase [Oceanobacter mangrovi]
MNSSMQPTSLTKTTCPYCGVGCGVNINQLADTLMPVAGDSQHPANFGKLCVKGSSLHETVDSVDRLLQPQIHGSPASWPDALDLVAGTIQRVIAEHGPQAVAIYAAGQILTEDYYVANKLMKGFIGSANLDTNSRLCMASAVVAHKRAFGSDTVPGCYDDLEQADLLILVGSNAAWAHPILYQRMVAAKQARPDTKVVVIDPRKTATTDLADLHLAIKPGSDGLLFNGLLAWLANNYALDQQYIERHTEGFAEALQQAQQLPTDLDQLAELLEIEADDLRVFFDWFLQYPKTVTFFSQGINQSSTGVDKGNAIINVHLATGRIGKPGACPFSITGQPNAMGGREVGGLANQLAAHMDFSAADIDRVQRFWNAPNMATAPGHKAVDLFNAIQSGEIKFLWVISTNPLVSMPDADAVKAALKQCELVVVSDCMANTDTTAVADVLLPAASWGEKNGTVTNSERRISRQRSFLAAAGEAKPDWWILTQVAERLGFNEAFNYQHPAEIFDEYTRLTGFENNGSRDLDLSGLSGMSQQQYDQLTPIQWPVNASWPRGRARLFDDNHFFTPSHKARFVAIKAQLPASRQQDGELIMNTGRVRDHWHTMTRTAKSARLAQHIREPYVSLHPADAERLRVEAGQLARVSNPRGAILLRAQISSDQRPGEVFVPMHWTSRYASQARMGVLIDQTTDPLSGQPELKYTGVSVEPVAMQWQGMILSHKDLGPIPCDYWAYGLNDLQHGYEIAGNQSLDELISWLQHQFDEQDYPALQWQISRDPAQQQLRISAIHNQRLQLVLFTHRTMTFESRQWLLDCFRLDSLDAASRKSLLAGRPAEGIIDQGRIVCSCFTTGEKAIQAAIAEGCDSAEKLGAQLKCGTNCGSCVPELKALISEYRHTTA